MSGNGEAVRGRAVPWASVAQAATCTAFGAFVLARAIRLSLTYDEAAAYIRYIAPQVLPEFDAGPLAIFNFEVATNHLLSTALTRLSVLVAGNRELALRAPAVLGYAMYLWFSTRLLRRVTTPAIAIAGLLLLNLNPYLLDFFALSRGYGLSIGCLTGALHFFFAGRLRRTLLFASAGVLANFALLNVYLAIVAIIVFGGRWVHLHADAARAPRRRASIVLGVAAVVFAALVFSQDAGLSRSLYQPVTVTIQGLDANELQAVTMWRVDLRGRLTRVTDAGAFRALRIQMPAAIADRVSRIDVVVGDRAFSDDPHRTRAWLSHDADGSREFESGATISARRSRFRAYAAVMNWAGDAQYAAMIAKATALALAVLVLFALVLNVIGRVLSRAELVITNQWGAISQGLLWVAALAGPPLYLLKRDGQLYFGGTRGLVQDTFYSLIENSFYGRAYHAGQTQITFVVLVAIAVAFVVIGVLSLGRGHARSLPLAAQLAAIIAIVSVSLVAQHWLFGTVYLAGRTALFYIPLYMLFLIMFCQALTEAGRAGTVTAAATLIVAVALSAFHFVGTANLQYTLDWRDDADTKGMMADLEGVVSAERSGTEKAVLGVEWIYAPAAVYYARRRTPVDIDIAVAPYSRMADFSYVAERHAAAATRVVKRYRIAGAVLARAR